jgi:probable HAF family extracellular repeat protein
MATPTQGDTAMLVPHIPHAPSCRLAAALLLAAAAVSVPAQPRYTIQDLGTLGGPTSSANAISQQGAIVGDSNRAQGDPLHAVAWVDGAITDLGGFSDAALSYASAVNSEGVACGTAEKKDGGGHAVVWKGGHLHDLSALRPDWITSNANGINGSGHVVGTALSTTDFTNHAFIWKGGTPHMLAVPASAANGMNDNDEFVGNVRNVATLFANGRRIRLGTFGGSNSDALAINAGEVVTGWAAIGGTQDEHAFRWMAGVMTDLGTLGGDQSRGNAIAGNGDVVGWANRPGSHKTRAMLVQGDTMVDLNDLIPAADQAEWNLLEAFGINDSGVIVGQGKHHGEPHAFVLTPVQ